MHCARSYRLLVFAICCLSALGACASTPDTPPASDPSPTTTPTDTPSTNGPPVQQPISKASCDVDGRFTKLQPGHQKWAKGMSVLLEGVAVRGPIMCTKMMCSKENPCCNRCSGSMQVKGFENVEFRGLECSGDNCNVKCAVPEHRNISLFGQVSDVRGTRALVQVEKTCEVP